MTRILEGTWEEIKTHDAELTGLRLRVIIEPAESDATDDIPAPPNTIRDKAHLEELLLEGINSGLPIVVDEEYWADIRQRVRERIVYDS
jgi:hypothetical protein